MQIEMDGAVWEYLERVVINLKNTTDKFCSLVTDPDDQNEVFMRLLESMVMTGAAKHHFDIYRNVDVFVATDHLVRHWQWCFPGSASPRNRSDIVCTKVRGKRSKYMGADWGKPDPSNQPPRWPD